LIYQLWFILIKNKGKKMHDSKEYKGLSLILPVYNEVQAIRIVLEKLLTVLDGIEDPVELIVVDDGSTDGTADILESFSDRIKIFRHPINRGYGATLKTGIRHAAYPIVAITDADGTYPNEQIPKLFDIFKRGHFDMVVGARTGKNVYIPFLRRPAKWFINKLANYLTEMKIPDLNSGLRLMKKDVIRNFFRILPSGFSFTSTITLALLTNGFSVKFEEIDYFGRVGKSKIRPIKDTINFVQQIVRTTMYFNPLKIFLPLSMFLVVFAFLVLFGSWFLFGKAMDMSFGVLIMTAVMVSAIGMLADLINKRIK
jgi:glycosyltransferase involved in cell wall biosynthesis